MKYQLNKLIIVSAITLVTASSAYAGCEWTNGSLGQTVKSTSDRLKRYSECKTNCKQLEIGLSNTISLMNTSSECGADVLTPKNSQMVEFFDRRFKLIRKLKSGSSHTFDLTPSEPLRVSTYQTEITATPETYKPLLLDNVRKQELPISPSPIVQQNVTQHQASLRQQRIQQEQLKQEDRVRKIELAYQQHIAKQRQIQKQKQALIHLQNKRNAEARKRRIQLVQHQERIRKKQLQQKRARVLHLAKQKARQQRQARAKN